MAIVLRIFGVLAIIAGIMMMATIIGIGSGVILIFQSIIFFALAGIIEAQGRTAGASSMRSASDGTGGTFSLNPMRNTDKEKLAVKHNMRKP